MTRAPNPLLWPEHLVAALNETETLRLKAARKATHNDGKIGASPLDVIDLLHTIATLRVDLEIRDRVVATEKAAMAGLDRKVDACMVEIRRIHGEMPSDDWRAENEALHRIGFFAPIDDVDATPLDLDGADHGVICKCGHTISHHFVKRPGDSETWKKGSRPCSHAVPLCPCIDFDPT